jgi:hypothetical protein
MPFKVVLRSLHIEMPKRMRDQEDQKVVEDWRIQFKTEDRNVLIQKMYVAAQFSDQKFRSFNFLNGVTYFISLALWCWKNLPQMSTMMRA